MREPGKFWDRIAERYARKPVADEAAYQEKLRVTREYLRPDMEVLEFGCGTGSTAIAHAPYVKHILATDISAKMIEIARDKAAAGNVDNVTFERTAIEDLAGGDQTFDAVMGHSILHLVDDKDATISKVHALLKPGGIFVSSTACIADRMKFFKLIAPIGAFFGLIPLVRVFSRQDLIDSLTGAGFTIEHQQLSKNGLTVFIVAKKAG